MSYKLKYSRNENGSALILVIIIFLVLIVFGAGVMTAMTAEARQSSIKSSRTQAYYFARSGVEVGYDFLSNLEQDKIDNWLNDHNDLIVYIFGDVDNLSIRGSSTEIFDFDVYNENLLTNEEEIFATIEIDSDFSFYISGRGRFAGTDITADTTLTLFNGRVQGSSNDGSSGGPPSIPSVSEIDDRLENDENYSSALDTNWMNNGGRIQNGGINNNISVVFSNDNLRVTPTGNMDFTARDFYFTSELNVNFTTGHSTALHLTATGSDDNPGLIIFDEKVTLGYHQNHGSGRLCLDAPQDSNGVFFQFRGGLYSEDNPISGIDPLKVYYLEPGTGICFPDGIPQEYPVNDGDGGWKNIIDWAGRWN